MSSYAVSIGEREYTVKIGPDRIFVDGEPVACELTSLNGNGLHQLSRENQRVEVYLNALPRSTYEILIGGRRVIARVDPAHRRRRAGSGASAAGDLVAPMPGLVVDVITREGDVVEKGQLLVVQEAMKMQMQLRAPCTGTVEQLAARAGEQVEKDALLVRVTPPARS